LTRLLAASGQLTVAGEIRHPGADRDLSKPRLLQRFFMPITKHYQRLAGPDLRRDDGICRATAMLERSPLAQTLLRIVWALLTLLMLLPATPASAETTLQSVRKRGFVVCGVSDGVPGFSTLDIRGTRAGLDIDLCRALAAALFSNEKLATFKPYQPSAGLAALIKGEVDVLTSATDWTLSLDPEANVRFVGPSFFDGQVILVPDELGTRSVLQLSNTRICLRDQQLLAQGLEDYFGSRDMPVTPLPFYDATAALGAYQERKCEAFTDTLSQMGVLRGRLKLPDQHTLLPQVLSNLPLGPVVRQGDESWFDLNQLVLNALVAAEEVGLSQEGPYIKEQDRPTGRVRLLALESRLGQRFGLATDWGTTMITRVGNYGELYQRNLGSLGPFGQKRGNNNLWSKGGLFYTPLIR
jgi:general L-amino acid transport system substrate-binding protein